MNKIKKFFPQFKISYLLLGLLLGLSISVGVVVVKAALSHVSSGQILKASDWNALVDQVNSLVAEGSQWPTGNYCIIQDQAPHSGNTSASISCPNGFVAVNPTNDNFDTSRGIIYGGDSSKWDATPALRADESSGTWPIRKWAFCCKM